MDIYTLTNGFQHDEIIEGFETCIWTHRYSQFGDFKLTVPDTAAFRTLLQEGTLIGTPSSRNVMILDTPLLEDGKIKCSGEDLKGFLKNRILRNTYTTNGKKYWELTGTPGYIAGQIVMQMCGPGGLVDTNAVMANGDPEIFLQLVNGPAAGGSSVTLAVEYGNVYDGVKGVCDIFDLGFDFYPTNITDSDYDLIFTTWAGLDRTSDQSVNEVVIFEPALDSLANTKELRSISGYKNAAYAWAPNISSATYSVGSATTPDGATATEWNRRTLMVSCDDINSAPTSGTLIQLLNQRAMDALANNNYVRMVDGELVPQTQFQYGLDYFLGDVIELRSESGTSQHARVTEYVLTQDSTGERAYPTLSVIS